MIDYDNSSPVLNMFFIDELVFQDNVNVIGLASVGGKLSAIEKRFAIRNNINVNSHELGHNLSLGHLAPGLMAPSTSGNSTLVPDQLMTIFNSRFVQGDQASGFFIEIEPYEIVASVVPLPAALPLYGSGLALIVFIGWRKRRQMA